MIVVYILGGLAALFMVLPAIAGAFLDKNHTGSRSVWLRTDPGALWDVITNHTKEIAWRTDLKSIEPLPDHQGNEAWKEVSRTGQEMQLATVEKKEKQKLVRTIINNRFFGGQWILELFPENNGTRLTVTEKGTVHNPVFRFMFRVFFSPTSTIDKYLQMLGAHLGQRVELSA